jgi:type II secretion system protein G
MAHRLEVLLCWTVAILIQPICLVVMVYTMATAEPSHIRSLEAKFQLGLFNEALTEYKSDVGSYPPEALGLDALWYAPNIPNWHGPYLKSGVPVDPWGRPYVYHLRPNRLAEIISYGADGRPGGEGIYADISNLRLADNVGSGSVKGAVRILAFVTAAAGFVGYPFLPWFLRWLNARFVETKPR